MELKHIEIGNLSVSRANTRGIRKAPDLTNILPSVRARGILVPLIVRQNGSPETYEIVAGKRRYHAALAIVQSGEAIEPLPCAVMEAGDDAAALEASLIENIARLDPDEVTRWESFTRLVREGRTPEDISLTFGLTELQVKRTLALGNLLPRIRQMFRSGGIDVPTIRHLTLASKTQQREWLALRDGENGYAPTGSNLKAWLFGGASIPVKSALFDIDSYGGETVSDLFGEDRYFASAGDFWTAQMAAVEEQAEAYRAAKWSEVVVLEPGEPFHLWEHERCAKKKGGKVFAAIGHRGDATFHEGCVSLQEARRLAKGESVQKPVRPEITGALQDYVDLHRHAAVRARMAEDPGIALRVTVAHMISGSPLWAVRLEPQSAAIDAIAESVESSTSEAMFDEKRRAVMRLLGSDPEYPTVTRGYDGAGGATGLLVRLLDLSDAQVLDVLAIAMGETLDARSDMVDLLGIHLAVDMAPVWQADAALIEGIRDREVLLAMVAEVAGDSAAAANAKETGKILKTILADCIAGTNGRAEVDGWVPRWMQFPPASYTSRSGVGSLIRSDRVVSLLEPAAPAAASVAEGEGEGEGEDREDPQA